MKKLLILLYLFPVISMCADDTDGKKTHCKEYIDAKKKIESFAYTKEANILLVQESQLKATDELIKEIRKQNELHSEAIRLLAVLVKK